MILGMTSGETALVVFIFFLVYGAGFLPRIGDWVGTLLFSRSSRAPRSPRSAGKGAGG